MTRMAEVIHLRPNREPAAVPESLWREALGGQLRAVREERGERLVDVAGRAGISPQYLSEIERGRKEPSSEMIAAVTGALGVDLAELLRGISDGLRRARALRREQVGRTQRAAAPPARRPADPVLLAA